MRAPDLCFAGSWATESTDIAFRRITLGVCYFSVEASLERAGPRTMCLDTLNSESVRMET